MEAYIVEWLSLLIRWVHVIAAIAWIGHAFLFHSFEHGIRPPEVDDVSPDVHGELWMVHGGGFFRLQKTRVLPDKYTGELMWFKWEAAFTWMSGFLLLGVLFYMGGGVYLVDPGVAEIDPDIAIAISLATLIGGWFLYDFMWASPLGKQKPAVATAFTVVMIVGAAYGLTRVMSGRAAYLHVGALMGTIMAANVWVRILPGMRKMIAAMERGEEPDLSYGAIGKQRSLANGYMHFPIIFVMISNHFPSTYASEHRFVILLLIMVLGATMRQVMYDGLIKVHIVAKLLLAVSVGGLIFLTLPEDSGPVQVPVNPDARAIDSATVGTIRGTIKFAGQAPAPKQLKLFGGCENTGDGQPRIDDSVLVAGGRLQNALVYIEKGHEDWQPGPVPGEVVEVDQRGCIYSPRVVAARVGQKVVFINSDAIYHNVHGQGASNPEFNLNMPQKNQRIERVFKRPDVVVQSKCDVHPWMRANIGVFAHDWFAVTGPDGSFTLSGVPPGSYELEIWHEVYGKQRQTVTVPESGTVDAEFTVAP